MISRQVQNTINSLNAMADTHETIGASHTAGWMPEPNLFNVAPMTIEEANKANRLSLNKASEYRDIAKRLQNGEVVEGWMPGDEYK